MENIGHVPMYIPYIYVYIYTYISQVGALTHLFSWHPRSWFASFSYFCPGWVSLRYSISLCHLSWWLLSWLLLHMYILIYVTELYIYIYVYIYIFIMCLLSHLLTGMHLQFVAGFSQRGVRHGCLEGIRLDQSKDSKTQVAQTISIDNRQLKLTSFMSFWKAHSTPGYTSLLRTTSMFNVGSANLLAKTHTVLNNEL